MILTSPPLSLSKGVSLKGEGELKESESLFPMDDRIATIGYHKPAGAVFRLVLQAGPK